MAGSSQARRTVSPLRINSKGGTTVRLGASQRKPHVHKGKTVGGSGGVKLPKR